MDKGGPQVALSGVGIWSTALRFGDVGEAADAAAELESLGYTAVWLPVGGGVLAALGPRMLEVAAKRAAGVHPYLVTPDHTRRAREVLGATALVAPEQSVILCATQDEARAVGVPWLQRYLELPNYAN